MVQVAGALVACLAYSAGSGLAQAQDAAAWSDAAAANYLDERLTWWMDWPPAARDRGTFCVSCHTAVPYAMARPHLRPAGRAVVPGDIEGRLLRNVETRVTAWSEVEPFYSDARHEVPKTRESRGTEAVLNALILSTRDAHAGELHATTVQAFDNLWALQLTSGPSSGAWPWLNFDLDPWEVPAAQYYGAALAALAVARAPDGYGARDHVHTRVAALRRFLRDGFGNQRLFNRVTALWAAASFPDLLDPAQEAAAIDDVFRLQREDGGWALSSLGSFARRDGTPLETTSDGYATGMVMVALGGVGRLDGDPRLERGLGWLRTHQALDGSWSASSLNRRRAPDPDRGRFMSDAATAYAVIALTTSIERAPERD